MQPIELFSAKRALVWSEQVREPQRFLVQPATVCRGGTLNQGRLKGGCLNFVCKRCTRLSQSRTPFSLVQFFWCGTWLTGWGGVRPDTRLSSKQVKKSGKHGFEKRCKKGGKKNLLEK